MFLLLYFHIYLQIDKDFYTGCFYIWIFEQIRIGSYRKSSPVFKIFCQTHGKGQKVRFNDFLIMLQFYSLENGNLHLTTQFTLPLSWVCMSSTFYISCLSSNFVVNVTPALTRRRDYITCIT